MSFKTIEDIINKSQEFNQNDKNLIKNEGVVFTSKDICDRIINQVNPKINESVCEPSVGRGSFVFSLLEKFRNDGHSIIEIKKFIENNLYCFDINEIFINDLKEMITSYLNILGYNDNIDLKNIKCEDFLTQSDVWDNIIGNPPYVRIQNLDKKYLDSLKNDLKSISLGNIDLYYAFLEKSINSSNKVGFIVPNSFIKTKSGKFLREIIKDNIKYIYNFEADKVWNRISTYTCIVTCESNTSDTLNYVTKHKNVNINKKDLSDEKWIFTDNIDGDNKLSDLINFCSGGLATIRDRVFKIDRFDDNFCYISGNKIEYGICKKVIKASKDKNFRSYNWIIYPYDSNGKILKEEYIERNYPYAYKYLLNSKDVLNKRDKGKTDKYDAWYAYGRRQGLLKKKTGTSIILPITFLRSRGIHIIEVPNNEECLVLSGISVDIKDDLYDEFIEVITSNEFYDYCEHNNKVLKGKNDSDDIWLSITTTTLRNYTF